MLFSWNSSNNEGSVNIVDNLLSTSTSSALSANQGRVLKTIIEDGVIESIQVPSSDDGNDITTGVDGNLYLSLDGGEF